MPVTGLERTRTVIDSETTGFYVAEGERIVSLGAVRGTLEGGVSKCQSWILDTGGRQSSPGALAVHRIRADDPRRIPERDGILGLREFVGDSVAVFQNAPFDMAFLDDACDRLGLPRFTFEIEDTIVLGRERFPGQHVNLDALLKRLGIGDSVMARRRDERHEVLDDCLLTFEVWRQLATPARFELVTEAAAFVGLDPGAIETIAMEW